MPHQCVRCNTFYDDGAKEILSGCSCGGKLFFFIKKSALEESKKIAESLTPIEKEEIEQDVYDMVGSEIDREAPVVLDLESIRILKPGKYELDLVQLFNNQPLIFKLEDGKYVIDLPLSFRQGKKKRK
jgi:predicted  nucleic acid-binding Zn-ribbon protein